MGHHLNERASPEEIIFDANLQEFATRIGYICALETSGKLPPADAYKQIKSLWSQLKKSKKNLLNDKNKKKKHDEDAPDAA